MKWSSRSGHRPILSRGLGIGKFRARCTITLIVVKNVKSAQFNTTRVQFMSSPTARPFLVSTNDHSALISIIAWVLIVITAFSVLIRLSTRFAITKKFKTDDVFIVIALVRRLEIPHRVPFTEAKSRFSAWYMLFVFLSRQSTALGVL